MRRVTLVALAAVAWVLTASRMRGMDAGPGTDLGALGWFAVSAGDLPGLTVPGPMSGMS